MTAARETPRLSRSLPDTPAAPPVRMVHLGVGNFHRAHQAWYTAHSPDADAMGHRCLHRPPERHRRCPPAAARPVHLDHPQRRGRHLRADRGALSGARRRRARNIFGLPGPTGAGRPHDHGDRGRLSPRCGWASGCRPRCRCQRCTGLAVRSARAGGLAPRQAGGGSARPTRCRSRAAQCLVM